MRISNKRQMYELLREGAFGNTVRTWDSPQALEASNYRGLIGVRSKIPGAPFLAYTPYEEALKYEGCVLSEMQEDSRIMLQGEVVEAPDIHLHCSAAKTHMRAALRLAPKFYTGLQAKLTLLATMDRTSYENLVELLATYPYHAVEFSVYDGSVEVLGWNTVFWEVRSY